jgi:hypothetical protein
MESEQLSALASGYPSAASMTAAYTETKVQTVALATAVSTSLLIPPKSVQTLPLVLVYSASSSGDML